MTMVPEKSMWWEWLVAGDAINFDLGVMLPPQSHEYTVNQVLSATIIFIWTLLQMPGKQYVVKCAVSKLGFVSPVTEAGEQIDMLYCIKTKMHHKPNLTAVWCIVYCIYDDAGCTT